MSYTLKFEHPHFPDEQEFGLNDLGVVKNGGSLEVDEDQERQFIASQGKSIEDAFSNNPLVTLSGSSAISSEEAEQLSTVNSRPELVVEEVTPPENEGVNENE
jgi:flagellar capping protein FliD